MVEILLLMMMVKRSSICLAACRTTDTASELLLFKNKCSITGTG
jgi:hypothetical protein